MTMKQKKKQLRPYKNALRTSSYRATRGYEVAFLERAPDRAPDR
jgi:hypothetical protein